MQAAKGVPRKLHRPDTPSAYAPSLTERAILGMFRRALKYLGLFFYLPVNKVRDLNSFGPLQTFILTKNSLLCS